MGNSLKKNEKFSLIALCLGFCMITFDVTSVSMVLPLMESNLGDGIIGIQWIMDSYNFAFACLLLTGGRLADLVNARRVFLGGVVLFLFSSLGCAVVDSLTLIISFRFLQGVAAALILPASLALIDANYMHSKNKRAYIIGVWSSAAGVGAAMGPILGTLLTSWINWRAVFLVNIPFGLIAFIACSKQVKKTVPSKSTSLVIDSSGQIVSMISIALLVWSVIEGGKLGFTSFPIVLTFCLFLITGYIFLKIERDKSSSLIPFSLLKSPLLMQAILIGFIINFGFFGALFQFSLYFKEKEYSTALSGLAVFSYTGLAPLASYIAGLISTKMTPRTLLLMGTLMSAMAFFLLVIVLWENSSPYVVLFFSMMLIGFSCMFTVTIATIVIAQAVSNSQIGIASALFFTCRQVGSLIGIAVFGAMINSASSFIGGVKCNLIITGILFLIVASFTWLYFKDDWSYKMGKL